MCGINGVLSFNNVDDIDLETVIAFNKSISHRGPDNSSYYKCEHAVFGHVRLSIVDLNENSNQPMLATDGSIILVFNGEIYNHEALRDELEEYYNFNTDHSDTEVIIASYMRWGIKCLEKFVGMFAFALFDREENKFYLVRDRLGKKPLYYVKIGEKIYFSSENKAFFETGLLQKRVNQEAIYHYLTFLTVPAPNTFYDGVSKIEAGHYLEVTNGGIRNIKYWDVSEYLNMVSDDDYITSVDNTRRLLGESMAHRSVSDVPISIALSGGLDSSLNLSYLKDIRAEKIHAINVSYQETSKYDESMIAKRFADEHGVSYSANPISEATFIEWLEEYLAECTDIPAGDPNTSLLYGICKLSRNEGYKVLLVGEGGDELGGYPIYNKLNHIYKIDRYLPKVLLSIVSSMPIPYIIKSKLQRLKSVPPIAQRFIFGFPEDVKQSFWKGNKEFNSYKVIEDLAAQVHVSTSDSFLRKVVNVEYKLRLAELLLPRVDYPSMAASIEARSPFMDHRLIEYTATLPWALKMKNGPKSILRDIAKNLLPSYIMDAPKVGFGMLLTPFLVNTLPDWFENEILKGESRLKDYIDDNFLHSLHRDHKATKGKGYQMWVLYSLHKWFEVNFK